MPEKKNDQDAAQPVLQEEPKQQVQEPILPPKEEPKQLDKTVPGGRYVVDGRVVNANGEPIKE